MKFHVLITATIQEPYTIYAETEEAAEEKALDLFHSEVPISDLETAEIDVTIT